METLKSKNSSSHNLLSTLERYDQTIQLINDPKLKGSTNRTQQEVKPKLVNEKDSF